jgi:hypothetical protein
MKAVAIVALSCAIASAEPAKLRLEHQPPRLTMRPRSATVTPPSAPMPPPVPAPAPTTPPPNAELGVLRDVARPVAARFSLGYIVDGTTLTRDQRFDAPDPKALSQERAYALGQGYLSTQGVVLPSLSTYLAAQFQIVNQPTGTVSTMTGVTHPELRPPVATWFDRNGIEPRNLWAEIKDFLPDARFAPLRVRAGELYVYGPWVMHMYGANAAWDAKLVRAGVYVGTRVPDYTLHTPAAKDRALITGASLRIDLRDLQHPIPFAIAGEMLGLASLGSATGESSRHAQLEVDWRPRKDVALIGQARTRDAQLANEHVQLRSRYGQVTNLVFDVTHRHDSDWRWDPTVTETDPLAAKRYLDLGPVLPQLLASARAGTLIKENIDLYVRGAAATDLQKQDGPHSTFSANYLEIGGALEVRLRRTISLGVSGMTRETTRYTKLTTQINDVPGSPQMLPSQADPGIGEKGMTELGATLRMSLGARKFSATAEGFGRRTEYALVYCVAQDAMTACNSATSTGIPARDLRWGGRASVDAWIGQKLRVFASYELSSPITFQPWMSGYKSLQLVMEGIY